MIIKYRKSAAVALVAFYLLGHLTGRAETNPTLRAASVLFRQDETIVYTRSAFLLTRGAFDSKNVDSEENLMVPFVELIGGLDALGPNVANDLVKSYSAFLVGVKDFGAEDVRLSSDGLGLMGSHKVYIGILQGGPQPNVELDFRQTSYESIDGRQVWTWSKSFAADNSRPIKFYAAQIGASYFVMTNNRQDFQETVTALTSAESSKPASILASDWETFSTYNYWAHRVNRRKGVINLAAAGMEDLQPEVTALTFFADLDKRQSSLRVLSTDKNMQTPPKALPPSELHRLHSLEPGIWQATIPLSKDETSYDTVFYVFYCFGFAAAL